MEPSSLLLFFRDSEIGCHGTILLVQKLRARHSSLAFELRSFVRVLFTARFTCRACDECESSPSLSPFSSTLHRYHKPTSIISNISHSINQPSRLLSSTLYLHPKYLSQLDPTKQTPTMKLIVILIVLVTGTMRAKADVIPSSPCGDHEQGQSRCCPSHIGAIVSSISTSSRASGRMGERASDVGLMRVSVLLHTNLLR